MRIGAAIVTVVLTIAVPRRSVNDYAADRLLSLASKAKFVMKLGSQTLALQLDLVGFGFDVGLPQRFSACFARSFRPEGQRNRGLSGRSRSYAYKRKFRIEHSRSFVGLVEQVNKGGDPVLDWRDQTILTNQQHGICPLPAA
jgi:hypothetical protein